MENHASNMKNNSDVFIFSKQGLMFFLEQACFFMMGHGVSPYMGLNEIVSQSPIITFITINYLFNFIFGFIRWYFGFIY